MSLLLGSALLVFAGQAAVPAVQQRTLVAPDGEKILYGISVPPGSSAREPRPLVVALHPGGPRTPYYGLSFLRGIVSPALRDLGAVMIAPDCPPRSWTDAAGERAVLALVESVAKEYAIDRRRILVVGFSMGGRGTWFMAARHADLFTAAIPIAGSPGDEPLDRLGRIPTYIVHSRDDEVVPFGQDERAAHELERLGRAVRFEALAGVGHFEMGAYIDSLARAGRWVAERWSQRR